MKRYKICFEVDTSKELSDEALDEICKVFKNDLLESGELLNIVGIKSKWHQVFKISWASKKLGVIDGKTKAEARKMVKSFYKEKFKLSEDF